VDVTTIFAMLMMVMLLAKHIKDLLLNGRMFPFVSLILTVLIVLHIFTIDVNLAKVVKLQISRLF